MSFADVIFRIGASLGAWLIFIGHGLTVAVIPQADCDPASDTLWRGTLLLAALSGFALLFAGRGLPWRSSIRWFAAVGVALGLVAAKAVWPGVALATLGGEPLCGIAQPTGPIAPDGLATALERVWPIAQLAVVALGIGQGLRFWRPQPPEPTAD